MVNQRNWGIGLGLAAVVLGGCAVQDRGEVSEVAIDPAERPQVVATSGVLCDLARQIAEDTITLTCLLAPGQDPHTYQARPSDRQAVDTADLVLYDGYDFAPSVLNVVVSSRNPAPKVAVLEAAVPNPLMGQGHDHDHDHDHSHDHESDPDSHNSAADQAHDHDHSHDQDAEASDQANPTPATSVATSTEHDTDLVPDPHVWHNARHNAALTEVIAEALAQINPDQASRYQANAAQLADQFIALDGWIQAQTATVPAQNRRLVTTHDAFRYFAEAYGFEVKGALSGLNTDAQPSPRSLTALVDQIKAATVPAIFAESTTNPALIQTVANNAGVAVAEQPLMVEGPGDPDSVAPNTQAMMVINTCTIVNALGGTCQPSEAPLTP